MEGYFFLKSVDAYTPPRMDITSLKVLFDITAVIVFLKCLFFGKYNVGAYIHLPYLAIRS